MAGAWGGHPDCPAIASSLIQTSLGSWGLVGTLPPKAAGSNYSYLQHQLILKLLPGNSRSNGTSEQVGGAVCASELSTRCQHLTWKTF